MLIFDETIDAISSIEGVQLAHFSCEPAATSDAIGCSVSITLSDKEAVIANIDAIMEDYKTFILQVLAEK